MLFILGLLWLYTFVSVRKWCYCDLFANLFFDYLMFERRHKDFLSFMTCIVMKFSKKCESYIYIKERVFRISDFARVQYYRWCVDPRQFRLEKQEKALLCQLYDRSSCLSKINKGILLQFSALHTSNRHKLTGYIVASIFFHGDINVTEISWKREIKEKKKEKGREKSGRNTFSSLRIKRKDDRRRDGDYTSRAKGRPCSSPLFQLSIGHRRKLHVAFPCVTMHAGYNRITLLLCHQEDHYAQPGARRRSERNCIV